MYTKVNSGLSEIKLDVLSLFTRGFNKEYYIREVERMLKISPRTAQRALEFFEKKSVLESVIKGKIRLYKMKQGSSAKIYLAIAEMHKRAKFFESHSLIKEVVEKISPSIKGVAILFGSYAKGTQKRESDLDIFIAGSCNLERIKAVSKMYGVKISVKMYPLNLFEKKSKEDFLIKEVLNNHIIIKGTETLIEVVVK